MNKFSISEVPFAINHQVNLFFFLTHALLMLSQQAGRRQRILPFEKEEMGIQVLRNDHRLLLLLRQPITDDSYISDY